MFWKYACSKLYIQENTHAKVKFIELTLRLECSSVNLLHIFRTPFPILRSHLEGCFCCIPSLPNKSFILYESKLNLIHNRWLFAKYVFFVFCLLHFKPSLATLFSSICHILLLKISNCNAVVSRRTRVSNRVC